MVMADGEFVCYFLCTKFWNITKFYLSLLDRNLKSNINLKTNDYEKVILSFVGVTIFVGSV